MKKIIIGSIVIILLIVIDKSIDGFDAYNSLIHDKRINNAINKSNDAISIIDNTLSKMKSDNNHIKHEKDSINNEYTSQSDEIFNLKIQNKLLRDKSEYYKILKDEANEELQKATSATMKRKTEIEIEKVIMYDTTFVEIIDTITVIYPDTTFIKDEKTLKRIRKELGN